MWYIPPCLIKILNEIMKSTNHHRRMQGRFFDEFIDGFGCIGNLEPNEFDQLESLWNDWEQLGKEFLQCLLD